MTPSPLCPARARSGFTLLEALVALVVLGTSVAVSLGVLATGTSVSRRADTRVVATELAESRMEGLLLCADAGAGGAASSGEGAFAPPYAGFRWRTRVSAARLPGTFLVEVDVVGEGDSVKIATLVRR